jgi:hypothetical protein
MKAVCISILLAASLASAVSAFPDYPRKQAKECRVLAEKSGIVIGLEPVESVQTQRTYFGVDLAKKGFVPVFVVIENGTRSDSLIFDKSRVTYGDAASALAAPRTGTGAGKALALSAIPLIGGFAGTQAIADAAQIQHNLMKKEVQSTTISPGKSVHGFLYIPGTSKSSREKITLRIPISKAGTDEDLDLDLVF